MRVAEISGQEEATGATRESSLMPSLASEEAHGYIKAEDKGEILARLRRIEGQMRGVQRMVDEEAYCGDILTQLSAVVSASQKVALLLLKDHAEYCVREAVEGGADADEKVEELTAAVERFLRV
jgi:DNA-binding FrmR family transcriptional regulator